MNPYIRHTGDFRWENTPLLNYKEEGTHFKTISRQVLFEANSKLAAELRYFEIMAGGHSTLERHDHLHSVMIIQGRGKVLVGNGIYDCRVNDLISIPSLVWHQFRAVYEEPFGFLCLVNPERDRPERPNESTRNELLALPEVAEFIRL